jgi:YhcH/YjgK/YiaL family protein
MVYDSIKNAGAYFGLGSGIKAALEYFISYDVSARDTTPASLQGGIKILRPDYETAPGGEPKLEAHRKFIDVMYVVEGEEAFYYKPACMVTKILREYDPEIEACLAAIDGDEAKFKFTRGYFAVFFPEDAHCAGQLWDRPSRVKKLIAKVPYPLGE